ncbi:hypothetical protein JX266_009037 [Neoarthrinium moseri]|nr:hypothetical protein JX266_009037 [Neoarthrinium moseri]
MDKDRFEPEINSLVRRYSEKVAEEMPHDPLAQSLGTWAKDERTKENEDTEWQEWLRFKRPANESDSALLQRQCEEVAKTWEQFKKHFPNLSLLEGVSSLPTIESLQEEVCEAQAKWAAKKEKGFGKAKDHTMSFLETLEGHKALFSVIPSGDKYTSLFTGVISSVVKASVNYEHIAEGFSRALADMSADLRFVQESTAISSSPQMKELIVELYVQVFKFLCEMMTWYSSPGMRFRKAFNSRFYDKQIDSRVKDIRLLIKRVERETSIQTQRRVKVLKHDIRGDVEDIAEKNRRQLEQFVDRRFSELAESMMQMSLGRNAAGLLSSNAQRMLPAFRDKLLSDEEKTILAGIYSRMEIPEDDGGQSPPPGFAQKATLSPSFETSEAAKQNSSDIQSYFGSAERYAEDDKTVVREELQSFKARQARIPEEIIDRLRTWVLSPKQESGQASVLWIEDAGLEGSEEPLRVAAYHIYEASSGVDIPAVGFFHKREYSFQDKGISRHRAGTVALLYSLIQQLLPLMPDEVDEQWSLEKKSFKRLDIDIRDLEETSKGVKTSLQILEALLELAPSAIIFVIDGVEKIEHQKNIAELRQLDHLLRTKGDVSRRKILYVTSGACVFLDRATHPVTERANTVRLVQARRRSPMPGSVGLDEAHL